VGLITDNKNCKKSDKYIKSAIKFSKRKIEELLLNCLYAPRTIVLSSSDFRAEGILREISDYLLKKEEPILIILEKSSIFEDDGKYRREAYKISKELPSGYEVYVIKDTKRGKYEYLICKYDIK